MVALSIPQASASCPHDDGFKALPYILALHRSGLIRHKLGVAYVTLEAILLHINQDEHVAWCSAGRLATHLGCSERQVRRDIEFLESIGAIIVGKRDKVAGGQVNEYALPPLDGYIDMLAFNLSLRASDTPVKNVTGSSPTPVKNVTGPTPVKSDTPVKLVTPTPVKLVTPTPVKLVTQSVEVSVDLSVDTPRERGEVQERGSATAHKQQAPLPSVTAADAEACDRFFALWESNIWTIPAGKRRDDFRGEYLAGARAHGHEAMYRTLEAKIAAETGIARRTTLRPRYIAEDVPLWKAGQIAPRSTNRSVQLSGLGPQLADVNRGGQMHCRGCGMMPGEQHRTFRCGHSGLVKGGEMRLEGVNVNGVMQTMPPSPVSVLVAGGRA